MGKAADPIDELIEADSKAFDERIKKREQDRQYLDSIMTVGRVCVGAVACLATYMAINGIRRGSFGLGEAISGVIAVALLAMVVWWKSIDRYLLRIPAAAAALIFSAIAVDWVADRFDERRVRICGEHIEEPCDLY